MPNLVCLLVSLRMRESNETKYVPIRKIGTEEYELVSKKVSESRAIGEPTPTL